MVSAPRRTSSRAQNRFLTRTAAAIRKTDKFYFFSDLRESTRSLRNGTKIRRSGTIIFRLHATNNAEFHTLSSENSVKLNNSICKTFLQFLYYFIIIAKKNRRPQGFPPYGRRLCIISVRDKLEFLHGRWLQKVSKVPVFKECNYKKSLYYRLISLILEISPLHKISRFSVILSADQSHHFSCSRQAIVSSSNRLRITLIGFPPTM